MFGPHSECQIRLHRDALNTPWGFRLQGGKDFKTPLTVQRVFVGSPADGDLQRGDILVAIDNYDTNHLTHKQAQDVIKQAGGSLSLRLKRRISDVLSIATDQPAYSVGAGVVSTPQPAFASPAAGPVSSQSPHRSRPLDSVGGGFSPQSPQGMNYSIDYSRGQQYSGPGPASRQQPAMLKQVQNSLQQSLWTPEDGQDTEYQARPIGEIKQMFSGGRQQQRPAYPQPQPASAPRTGYQPPSSSYQAPSTGYQPARKQPWRKPASDTPGLSEPGWAPKAKSVYAVRPQQPMAPSVSHREIPPRESYQTEQKRHSDIGRPAWSGSLRGSGGPKPWEIHAGESLVPGGVDANIPTGPSSVPQQARQSGHFQPQQQQQQQQQQQPVPQQHSPNVQPHQPRAQNVHYAPGQSPHYQQGTVDPDSESAKIVHSQYNSPLGLYSRENVQQALEGQTYGKPGQGTMAVTGGDGKKVFNPAQSDVYRLLQEEEEIRQRSHQQPQQQQQQQQSARYQQHDPGQEMQYQGYLDPSQKSPAMQALEHNYIDEGTSDF